MELVESVSQMIDSLAASRACLSERGNERERQTVCVFVGLKRSSEPARQEPLGRRRRRRRGHYLLLVSQVMMVLASIMHRRNHAGRVPTLHEVAPQRQHSSHTPADRLSQGKGAPRCNCIMASNNA